jgi:hypothetical protein
MSFQLRALHLFNRQGERESIEFKLNEVNIITGDSRTGKSSIIHIIDYCLGSASFNVAAGVIRQTVAVYAVEFETPAGRLLTARAAPSGKNKTNIQMHVSFRGPESDPPTTGDLSPNADRYSAISIMSRALGIAENSTNVGSGARDEFDATIRHSLFFCIQDQDEIASQDLLFHNQGEEGRRQTIRDILPYFLGVTDRDFVRKREKLRSKERELRTIARRSADEDSMSKAPGRAASLVAEAAALGLLTTPQEMTRDVAIAALSSLVEPEDEGQAPADREDELDSLLSERQQLRTRFSDIKAEERRLRRLIRFEDDFNGEAGERRSRLASLNLLRVDGADIGVNVCPVCSSELEDPITSVAELRDQLTEVGREIATVSDERSQLQEALSSVEQSLMRLNEALASNQQAIDDISDSVEFFESLRDISLQRAAVRGRISLFLSSVSRETEGAFLEGRLRELNEEIEVLRSDLNLDLVAERQAAALSRISFRITRAATQLQLEHSPAPVRLDPRLLTVIVDSRDGSYQLREIGSAANWLGYHIATLVGLHDYFVENDRPVPRLMMLDQPSQVYFPPDAPELEPENDTDRLALTRAFDTLFDFVEEASDGFQIIVLEHADLSDERFQNSIRRRWRTTGAGLIPQAWIRQARATRTD